jgi:hypothetical protein
MFGITFFNKDTNRPRGGVVACVKAVAPTSLERAAQLYHSTPGRALIH